MKRENYFFAIAGNIGVGKTTWTKMLSTMLNWYPHYEKVIENPYIENFYKDMKRWSFHSQIFFLTHRFKDHIKIQNSRMTCVQDRTIYEDGEIFARNLYLHQKMSVLDYKTYQNLYESMTEALRYPDLIIYLRASTWKLISRIRKRGRDYERDIDKEYLAQLNVLYDKWIKDYAKTHRVLVVETDKLDLEFNENQVNGIIQQIGAYQEQLDLFPRLNVI